MVMGNVRNQAFVDRRIEFVVETTRGRKVLGLVT
jgi:hypothetical protein